MVTCNLEEYENPIRYDFENGSYEDDIEFLKKWAANVIGPIIDLACGTGRATIPLSHLGHEMIGVDIHNGMLKEARNKAEKMNLTIEWIEQDCTQLSLTSRSSMIFMTGNSFQHFLTNESQDALLTHVHDHLHSGGHFIFNARFPSSDELLQPEREEYWRTYKDPDDGMEVDVFTISKYRSLEQIQHYKTIRKKKDLDGGVTEEMITNIHLRYTYPKELERLMVMNGFIIEKFFSNWNEEPLSETSSEMICICKKM